MNRCLIIDTETTGLDASKDRLIEVGAVLYSIANRSVLQICSGLVPADTNAAFHINRIPVAALVEVEGTGWMDRMREMADASDAFVAHNAEFDRNWASTIFPDPKPWLCTKSDFSWPHQTREGNSLINLALEHGIGVGTAHRAITDCLLIAELFNRMSLFGCDLDEMFAHALRPKSTFKALVPYEKKDLAKAAGFNWNGDTKSWTKRMALEDVSALPFRAVEVTL